MRDINTPSEAWIAFKKKKKKRDERLEAWRDGIIIILITLFGMIEI